MVKNRESSERFNFNNDTEVQKRFDDYYDFAYRNWAQYIEEADEDLSFYLGKTWSAAEKKYLRDQRRSALEFNKIKRVVKMITGYERKTRMSLIAQAVETGSEDTADQLTALMLWQLNQGQFQYTMSDAFEGAIKVGMNLASLTMDYSNDPLNGDLVLNRLPHNSFLLDPRMTKRDLSDSEFVLQRKVVSKNAAIANLPDKEKEIIDLSKAGYSGMNSSFNGGGIIRFQDDDVVYDEMWETDLIPVTCYIGEEMGVNDVITKEDKKDPDIRRLIDFYENDPNIFKRDKFVENVKQTVLINGRSVGTFKDPYRMGVFPHIPVMAYFDPEYNYSDDGDSGSKVQGIVRSIRDPQKEFNKRRSKMLDIMDTMVQTGWQAKEGSVQNEKDLYNSGQGKVIWMKNNAQLSDAQQIRPPEIPQSLFQAGQTFDQDIMEISGANNELFGMPEDGNLQIAGVLAKLRQGAGLTTLQDLFDHFRLSQQILGNKMIKAIQNNFSPQKIERIIQEKPKEEFYEKNFGKYDVVIEEAVETPTQKSLNYMQLVQAKQSGISIPDSVIIEAMPLQRKDKLIAAVQQSEQQKAEQQKLVDEQINLSNQMSVSKMISDLSLALERRSRMTADEALAVERISESQQNQADTILKRLKAQKELEELDSKEIVKFLGILKGLENQERDAALSIIDESRQTRSSELVDSFGLTKEISDNISNNETGDIEEFHSGEDGQIQGLGV